MLQIDDSLQYLRSWLGVHSTVLNILPWNILSRCVINEGHIVTRCQGVSSFSLQCLQVASTVLSFRFLCLFRLQCPVINCTIFPRSNLEKFFNSLFSLLLLYSNHNLVCLQLVRFIKALPGNC